MYHYLLDRGEINAVESYDVHCLKIFSREVLDMIKNGDPDWETMVPEPVAEVIKSKSCFDYQPA